MGLEEKIRLVFAFVRADGTTEPRPEIVADVARRLGWEYTDNTNDQIFGKIMRGSASSKTVWDALAESLFGQTPVGKKDRTVWRQNAVKHIGARPLRN